MADWREPYAQDFLGRAQNISNMGYTPFGQSTNVQSNPYQQQAWQSTFNRGQQGSPVMNAANGQLTDTINGKGFDNNPFLSGSNPYLESSIGSAMGDVTRNYNMTVKPQQVAAGVHSGSFGNSGIAEANGEQQRQLAQELGRVDSGMRMQDYSQRAQMYGQERQNQMSATQQAPTFANADYTDLNAMQQAGTAMQQQDQNQTTADYNQYLDQRNFPFQTFGAYSQAMGNGAFTYPQQSQPNTTANALGGALAGGQIGNLIKGSDGTGNAGWGALLGGLAGFLK